jgi:hypothetical protein
MILQNPQISKFANKFGNGDSKNVKMIYEAYRKVNCNLKFIQVVLIYLHTRDYNTYIFNINSIEKFCSHKRQRKRVKENKNCTNSRSLVIGILDLAMRFGNKIRRY